MAYLLALGSAALYGSADFLGGLASRRTNTIAIVVTSRSVGLALLALMLPLLPEATPSARDLVWGGAAGLTGGIGVALLYRVSGICGREDGGRGSDDGRVWRDDSRRDRYVVR